MINSSSFIFTLPKEAVWNVPVESNGGIEWWNGFFIGNLGNFPPFFGVIVCVFCLWDFLGGGGGYIYLDMPSALCSDHM